ncbi:hypothetical protein D3C87_2002230 [compost metagenome]
MATPVQLLKILRRSQVQDAGESEQLLGAAARQVAEGLVDGRDTQPIDDAGRLPEVVQDGDEGGGRGGVRVRHIAS